MSPPPQVPTAFFKGGSLWPSPRRHCKPGRLPEPSTLLHLRSRHPAVPGSPATGRWAHGHLLVLRTPSGHSGTQRLLPRGPQARTPGDQESKAAMGSGEETEAGRPLQAPGGAPRGGPSEDNGAGGTRVQRGDRGPQGAGRGVSECLPHSEMVT